MIKPTTNKLSAFKPAAIKILTVLACLLFSNAALANEKFKVVTTFTVIADMARNVAGDKAEVFSITKPGAEIHNYQPTPQDIVGAQDADLILWNGLNLEQWFEKFFTNLENVPSAIVTEGIDPISIGKGPYKGKPNPHAWMSPNSAIIYVDNITAAMAQHDPQNADTYRANADAYKQKIKAIIDPVTDALSAIPKNKRFLVTSEGAFSYLARDFDLAEVYIWPVNADRVGTPKQVRDVIKTVRKHNVPAVFSESTVPDAPAKQIARETDAKYAGILYVDSLSKADGPVPTYLDLLRITSQTIAAGLTQ